MNRTVYDLREMRKHSDDARTSRSLHLTRRETQNERIKSAGYLTRI